MNPVFGTDVCYDPAHGVYLVVGGQGFLYGIFTDTSGAATGPSPMFSIGTTNQSSHWGLFPKCTYGAAIGGGQGGFLVSWFEADQIHVQTVVDPSGATGYGIGADFVLGAGANNAVGGPNSSYSATSQRFLVVWPTAAFDTQARFVDASGAPSGSVMTIFPHTNANGSLFPEVTWNSLDDDFGVAFAGWTGSSGIEGFRRVHASDGALSPSTLFSASGAPFCASIEFNPTTHRYVMAWSVPPGWYDAEIDKDGAVVRTGLISSRVGTASSFGLSYNPVSGTFLAISEDNMSYQLAGLELNTNGVAKPATTMTLTNGGGTSGSFWPRVTARTDAKQWDITYSRRFTSIANQIMESTSSEAVPTPPPPPASNAQITIDAPSSGASVKNSFFLSGWAIDRGMTSGSGIDAVHVWAYPSSGAPIFVGAISTFSSRGDVGAVFGENFTSSGFGLSVLLPNGAYTIVAYPHSAMTGTFGAGKAITVTVETSRTLGSVDSPTNGSTIWQKLVVSGWAIDQLAPGGTGVDAVHVWAYPNPGSGQSPVFLGVAAYGGARPDVASIFGGQFYASGFYFQSPDLPPGFYRIVAFAHSAVNGAFANAATSDVTITSAMAVDQPLANTVLAAGSPIAVSGWAVDRNATGDAGVDSVHVWAFGPNGAQFLGMGAVGGARPDVGAILGAQFVNCGFWLTVPGVPPGAFDIVVYAHSRLTGTFNEGRAVRVTVR